jgi:ABC-type transporter Mla maintaining outer membrane lipid asymmetry permease subunit MlaE
MANRNKCSQSHASFLLMFPLTLLTMFYVVMIPSNNAVKFPGSFTVIFNAYFNALTRDAMLLYALYKGIIFVMIYNLMADFKGINYSCIKQVLFLEAGTNLAHCMQSQQFLL